MSKVIATYYGFLKSKKTFRTWEPGFLFKVDSTKVDFSGFHEQELSAYLNKFAEEPATALYMEKMQSGTWAIVDVEVYGKRRFTSKINPNWIKLSVIENDLVEQ